VELRRFRSLDVARRDLGREHLWAKILIAPFVLVRLIIGLVLEFVGKLLLLLVMGVTWLWVLAGRPSARGLGRLLRPVLRGAERAMSAVQEAYPRFARGALAHAGWVVLGTVAILAWTVYLFAGLGTELLPEVHQGEVTFELALPVGTPVEATRATLEPVAEAIRREVGHIDSLLVTYGFDAANTQRSDEGEHSARFKVLLESSDPATERQVVGAIRTRLAEVPDLDERVTRPVLFSSKTPIEVEVQGDDLARLKTMAARVRGEMASLPELADVETTLRSGAPEVQIVYDRQRLARFGLELRQVAEQVRNQVKGYEATRFNRQDRRIPVVVRLEQDDRETVRDVEEMEVNTGAARPIRLGSVSRVSLGEGPSEVRRIDGQRVAVVAANIASGSLGSAVAAIDRRLSSAIDWPDDMRYQISGQNEEWERSRASLWLALGLSIFLVYVIMAAQFENLIHPLVIMFTIPLAFFGTGLVLAAFGVSLSVVVFLGMIMLAGIVVNNAIVLIDYVNVLRRRGLPVEEAIVTAGRVRLRPIFMTTATTVLGLLPMAVGVGDGAEIRTPMALAVIGGLITSTLLTLVVIPVIYHLFDRLQARLVGRESEEGEAGDAGQAPAGSGDGAPGFARERTVEP